MDSSSLQVDALPGPATTVEGYTPSDQPGAAVAGSRHTPTPADEAAASLHRLTLQPAMRSQSGQPADMHVSKSGADAAAEQSNDEVDACPPTPPKQSRCPATQSARHVHFEEEEETSEEEQKRRPGLRGLGMLRSAPMAGVRDALARRSQSDPAASGLAQPSVCAKDDTALPAVLDPLKPVLTLEIEDACSPLDVADQLVDVEFARLKLVSDAESDPSQVNAVDGTLGVEADAGLASDLRFWRERLAQDNERGAVSLPFVLINYWSTGQDCRACRFRPLRLC